MRLLPSALALIVLVASAPAGAVVDNDGAGAAASATVSEDANALVPKQFLPLAQVLGTISPFLEERFDTFVLANTAEGGDQDRIIPAQHLRVLHRAPGASAFLRSETGQIVGINEAGLQPIPGIPALVPISSGQQGPGSIRTFSGVFRLNLEATKSKLATSPEAPMSFSTYIDFIYENGQASGVAMHGTPSANHRWLGRRRASHGCLRTYPAIARALRAHLMRPERFASDLPRFFQREILPNAAVQSGQSGIRPGVKVLYIVFNGY